MSENIGPRRRTLNLPASRSSAQEGAREYYTSSLKREVINTKERHALCAPCGRQRTCKQGTARIGTVEIDADFYPALSQWLEYKRNRRQTYKDDNSIKILYKKLLRLADNDPDIAMEVVEQSMGNNWSGLFELKESKRPRSHTDRFTQHSAYGNWKPKKKPRQL